MANTSLPERFMSLIDGDLVFYDLTSPDFE